MKFLYAIAILAQLAIAFLFRDENRVAYLLYLWNNLSGSVIHVGRHQIKPARVSKYKETKSNTSIDTENSFFLER